MKTNRRIRTLGVLLCMVSMLVFSGPKTDVYAGNIAFVVLNTYEQTMNIGDEYRLCAVTSNLRTDYGEESRHCEDHCQNEECGSALPHHGQ